MKCLLCRCGQTILVDDDIFEVVKDYKWHCSGRNKVVTSSRDVGVRPLSWFVLGVPEEKKVIDHVNLNGHDNRRENLRKTDHVTNRHNAKLNKDNTSGFR